jgi:hypothetical protein
MYAAVYSVRSTNATATICAYGVRRSAGAATMLAAPTSRPPLHAIISRRRSTRSANAPAGSANTASGSHWASPTTPAFAGERVTARISSGYATPDVCEPSSDRRAVAPSEIGPWGIWSHSQTKCPKAPRGVGAGPVGRSRGSASGRP